MSIKFKFESECSKEKSCLLYGVAPSTYAAELMSHVQARSAFTRKNEESSLPTKITLPSPKFINMPIPLFYHETLGIITNNLAVNLM